MIWISFFLQNLVNLGHLFSVKYPLYRWKSFFLQVEISPSKKNTATPTHEGSTAGKKMWKKTKFGGDLGR